MSINSRPPRTPRWTRTEFNADLAEVNTFRPIEEQSNREPQTYRSLQTATSRPVLPRNAELDMEHNYVPPRNKTRKRAAQMYLVELESRRNAPRTRPLNHHSNDNDASPAIAALTERLERHDADLIQMNDNLNAFAAQVKNEGNLLKEEITALKDQLNAMAHELNTLNRRMSGTSGTNQGDDLEFDYANDTLDDSEDETLQDDYVEQQDPSHDPLGQ